MEKPRRKYQFPVYLSKGGKGLVMTVPQPNGGTATVLLRRSEAHQLGVLLVSLTDVK